MFSTSNSVNLNSPKSRAREGWWFTQSTWGSATLHKMQSIDMNDRGESMPYKTVREHAGTSPVVFLFLSPHYQHLLLPTEEPSWNGRTPLSRHRGNYCGVQVPCGVPHRPSARFLSRRVGVARMRRRAVAIQTQISPGGKNGAHSAVIYFCPSSCVRRRCCS